MQSLKTKLQDLFYQDREYYKNNEANNVDHYINDEVKNRLSNPVDIKYSFFTIFDVEKYAFTAIENIDNVLGYKSEEFKIEKLTQPYTINQNYEIVKDPRSSDVDKNEIIHENDLKLVIVLGIIAYEVIKEMRYMIEEMKDYYQVQFRISKHSRLVKNDENRMVRIQRRCYPYRINKATLKSHLDIWTVIEDPAKRNIITWDLSSVDPKRKSRLNDNFNQKFLKQYLLLDFGNLNSEEQTKFFKLIDKGDSDKEIAQQLNITSSAVSKRMQRLKEDINYFKESRELKPTTNRTQIAHFLRKYNFI